MRGQIARISRNHVRRQFSQKIDPLRDCKWMSDNIALWFKELWRTILSESPMLAKSEMFHFLKNFVNTFAHIGYFVWRYDISLSQRNASLFQCNLLCFLSKIFPIHFSLKYRHPPDIAVDSTAGDDSAFGKQLYIGIASVGIIGLCAYPVFGSNTRPGHELFSSEKPEAIRESQEAKRKEYRRLIKEQRDQMDKEQDSWKK